MAKTDLNLDALITSLNDLTIGSKILYFDSLPSTMDKARSEAESGAQEGTAVVTDEQTKGRGRFQRTWLSPKGKNLLFSIVFYPELAYLNQMNMACSLSIAEATSELTNLNATIKWPNDVRINEKKIAGVLIENTLATNNVKYAIVGIGINVNWYPPEASGLIYPATSLSELAGRPISRTEVLGPVLKKIDAFYAYIKSGNSLRNKWSERLDTLGKHVKISMGNNILEGTAKDIDKNGNLILQKLDGSTVTVTAGEVTLRTSQTD